MDNNEIFFFDSFLCVIRLVRSCFYYAVCAAFLVYFRRKPSIKRWREAEGKRRRVYRPYWIRVGQECQTEAFILYLTLSDGFIRFFFWDVCWKLRTIIFEFLFSCCMHWQAKCIDIVCCGDVLMLVYLEIRDKYLMFFRLDIMWKIHVRFSSSN